MRKPLILILFLTFIYSCNNGKNELLKDSFIIEGNINHADQKKIALQKLSFQELTTVDSVILGKEGKFTFTIKPQEKEIYLLRKDVNHYISIIAEKGETIIFEADYDSFEINYRIKGSYDSELMMEFNNHLQPNLYKLDSIGKIWKTAINEANREEIKKDLDSCYLKILKDQRDFQLNFVIKNSSSLAALIALYQPLNREPVLKEETDFAIFEKVSNDLLKVLPNNSHTINFAKRIKQRKMIEHEKELTQKKNMQSKH
ncbi:MAG: DUF4369 domain-containing protein [Bacteroidales bacterium]